MSAEREARFLSGADIGRTISLGIPNTTGRIDAIEHIEGWVRIHLDPPTEYGVHTIRCLPNSLVTIEGKKP